LEVDEFEVELSLSTSIQLMFQLSLFSELLAEVGGTPFRALEQPFELLGQVMFELPIPTRLPVSLAE
jgi:hypothetical protein